MDPLIQAPLISLGVIVALILIIIIFLLVDALICWIDRKVSFDFENWAKGILLLLGIFCIVTFIVYVGLTK